MILFRMSVYQPTLNTLALKENKGTDYVVDWKSEAVYTSTLKPLYTAFLHSIKLSVYRMLTKFDIDSLNVDQNNYALKL